MLFNGPLFLFVFFPTLLILYYFFGRTKVSRKWVLLAASFSFYAWTEPLFVWIVIASSFADCVIGQYLWKAEREPARKVALSVGVVANLAILCVFKYTIFLVSNVDTVLQMLSQPLIAVPRIALPIGVSFVVFEKITYLVDVYRRLSKPAQDIWQYLSYVLFFPKLLAGPIIKYHDIISQFEAFPESHVDDFFDGLARFMQGLVKKTLLADTLASGSDLVFSQNAAQLTYADSWWGILFFTLQIYFDFSGYSDMAIGIGRMLGFHLLENFDRPYIATSITDFWRRWHISFTSWIREYLYFPLGGSRLGTVRTYFNLGFCFLASGIWHGAAWNFVIWGAYNGFFLILDRLVLLKWLERIPLWSANLVTILIVMVGWVFFRSTSLNQALHFLGDMSGVTSASFSSIAITDDLKTVAFVGLLICALPRLVARLPETSRLFDHPWRQIALQSVLALLFVVGVGKSIAAPFQPFLYFRF